MELTDENVHTVLKDCLFQDDEPTESFIEAEGIIHKFGFHPERLKSHEEDIVTMLLQLPDEFMRSKGGGWSFLQACNDKYGNLWTGLHRTMEELVCLGIGIGRVHYLMDRGYWQAFPGGVPYFTVDDQVGE